MSEAERAPRNVQPKPAMDEPKAKANGNGTLAWLHGGSQIEMNGATLFAPLGPDTLGGFLPWIDACLDLMLFYASAAAGNALHGGGGGDDLSSVRVVDEHVFSKVRGAARPRRQWDRPENGPMLARGVVADSSKPQFAAEAIRRRVNPPTDSHDATLLRVPFEEADVGRMCTVAEEGNASLRKNMACPCLVLCVPDARHHAPYTRHVCPCPRAHVSMSQA